MALMFLKGAPIQRPADLVGKTVAVPTGWTTTPWSTGGTATVGLGSLNLDAAKLGTTGTYAQGRSLEFVATFKGAANESAGFGVAFSASDSRAVFTNDVGGNVLYAVTKTAFATTRTTLAVAPKAQHRFRIDWTSTGVVYTVDGVVVATHTTTPGTTMRPLFSDVTLGLPSLLTVDWVRMSPYGASGFYVSQALDAGVAVNVGAVSWDSEVPTGTTMVVLVRTGNTPIADLSWSAWVPVSTSGGTPASLSGRYIKYQVQFTSTGTKPSTARLNAISIAYSAKVS